MIKNTSGQTADLKNQLEQAASFYKSGQFQKAAEIYSVVTDSAPGHIAAWAGLGMAQHDLGNLDSAETAFLRMVELAPQLISAHIVLSGVQRQLGHLDQAEASLDLALGMDQNNPSALANRGMVKVELGQIDAARIDLQKALKIDPNNVHATITLPMLSTANPGDPSFGNLENLALSEKITRNDHARIHFTLGKIYADINDYEASFKAYEIANNLQHIEDLFHDRNFNLQDLITANDRMLSVPLPELIEQDVHSPDTQPVFILGMPRSGKTILETLLAGHPQCRALGESDEFHKAARELSLLPLTEAAPDPQRCAEWAKVLSSGFATPDNQSLVLNTLPEAINLLPLIAWAFPDARIIFCDRNPLDLCLSAYFKNLRVAHNYSNHLDTLAAVQLEYNRVSQHFQNASGLKTMRIAYEDLVTDPEKTLTDTLEFLGLEFAEKCLPDSGDCPEIINLGPAQSLKGNKEIYSGYLGFWKNYETLIRPLVGILGDPDSAEQSCRMALIADPDDHSAKVDLARIIAGTGDYSGGVALCQDIAELDPTDTNSLIAMGDLYAAVGKHFEAINAYWNALTIRPYTMEMPKVYRDMQRSLEIVNPELARLHRDVNAIFRKTRQAFGDFGLLYQAFEPLLIPGHRPAEYRYEIYRLAELLKPDSRVLDIGCNAGFLSLLCADRVAEVQAFDIETQLVEIGQRVARYLGLENMHFSAAGFHDFKATGTYDLIFSFAVHHWIGMPMPEYANRLLAWLNPGGAIVFESQGRRAADIIEEDLEAKIDCLLQAGMERLWDGELIDDGINRRYFVVLRKT